jgi:hypothetical protein
VVATVSASGPTDPRAIEREEARAMLRALGLASLYLLPSLPPREAVPAEVDAGDDNRSASSLESTP